MSTVEFFAALVFVAIVLPIIMMAQFRGINPYGKWRSRYWGERVRYALEDPETRAAIYDAMEQEKLRRESGEDKPKRKLHD